MFPELKPQDIALDSVETIKEATELSCKCNRLTLLSDVSRTQIKKMSKRRRKALVNLYTSGRGYYDYTNGKLVHPRKSSNNNVSRLPIRVKVGIVDLSSIMQFPLQ